jgi:hypothetical protein
VESDHHEHINTHFHLLRGFATTGRISIIFFPWPEDDTQPGFVSTRPMLKQPRNTCASGMAAICTAIRSDSPA